MIRYFKKALPLSILATGIMASASFADTFTLRVGSGHPSKPTAYVTNMEKVLVPNIKKRVAAETKHKVGCDRVLTDPASDAICAEILLGHLSIARLYRWITLESIHP